MEKLRDGARILFEQALADCSVERAVATHVFVRNSLLHIGDERIDLTHIQRVRIVAAGKAASTMSQSQMMSTLRTPLSIGKVSCSWPGSWDERQRTMTTARSLLERRRLRWLRAMPFGCLRPDMDAPRVDDVGAIAT